MTDRDTENAGEATDAGDAADDTADHPGDDVSSLVAEAIRLSEEILDDHTEEDSDVADLVDDVQRVADEAAELLDAMDLTELPSAIAHEDVDELVVEEDLDDAVANLDPSEAIRLRKLLAVVDIGELWRSVDVRDVWRNKRELEDAVEEFTDDDGDDDSMLSTLTEDDEDDTDDDFEFDFDPEETLETGDDDMNVPDQAYETAIQSQLADSVEEFRQGLIAVHHRLARMREANRERTERVGQPSSRNPTAHSTLARTRPASASDAKYSTVPEESKYSSAPNRRRVYGSRFENERDDDA